MAQSLHRRVVLKSSVLSSAAILVTQRAQAVAANDTLTIALIGAGGQGRNHLKSYVGQSDVRIAYVCDVDEQHLDEARKIAPKAKAVSDLRRVLDDREVDAVAIATPDHWHTPAALLALAAGKHVYVEKPCSHNVREGRMLVAAAEKHRRVVQHGTQSRSNAFIQDSIKLLREGVIGKVIMARAWNVQFRPPIGHAAPSSPPATLDYDTWVGPAAFLPYQANRQHYTWHWWYNFGTGDAGNDGVHEIDIARWGLGVETHPQRIMAAGGKYVHDDDQQFPDTLTAVFDYSATGSHPARQLTFEMRLWDRNSPYGIDNGNEFLGTEGRMLLTKRGKVEVYDKNGKKKNVSLPKVEAAGIQPHQRNFISTIRGETKANADALTGHLSSSLPHLANIACRVGRGLVFDPTSETIQGDQQANELLGREYRQDYWATPKRS